MNVDVCEGQGRDRITERRLEAIVSHVIVIGGSGARVGKTRLAADMARRTSQSRRTIAMTVSMPADETHSVDVDVCPPQCRPQDSSLLWAGAAAVLRVVAPRSQIRRGLAAGICAARRMNAETLIIVSTMAGIEMKSRIESWFISGDGDWESWAYLHRNRADHVVTSAELRAGRPELPS